LITIRSQIVLTIQNATHMKIYETGVLERQIIFQLSHESAIIEEVLGDGFI